MMCDNKKILILNTGGTFNKVYDEINGTLIVPRDNIAIEKIVTSTKMNDVHVDGLIFKDSLEIDKKDRKKLKNYISKSSFKKIIIVHGTDTVDTTAKYLSSKVKDKEIILTGSMTPFSLNKIEPTANLMQAIGFLRINDKKNIYISMHGHIKKFRKLKKNRTLGIFECQN